MSYWRAGATDLRFRGMASSAKLRRRRAGLWPAAPPPRPKLGCSGAVGLFDGGALLSYDQAEHQGFLYDERFRHPAPGTVEGQIDALERRYERHAREERLGRAELYLEVGQLDLDNVDAILEFVSTYDVLDLRALDAPRMSRQWFGVATASASPFRILRYYPGFGDGQKGSSRDEMLRGDLVELVSAQRAAAPNWVVAETIDEFRWGARAIHDLHHAWLCLSAGTDPRHQPWANPRMPTADEDLAPADHAVRQFFEGTMRDALEGFSPRLWLVDDVPGRSSRAGQSPAPPDVTLFEVLVLELFRHIAEGATYKQCANETCGRTFVRQDGGAIHRQSRTTGVKYCSRTCANTVNQRRHRRRRTEKAAR